MLVSAKEGQIQTWWFLGYFLIWANADDTNFYPKFSALASFPRKVFFTDIYPWEPRYFATPPPTAGGQWTYHTDTSLPQKLTTRTPNLPHGQQSYHMDTKLTTRTPVSSKIFGLASIRVRATTWGGFGNFRRQLSIWSKVKRMCNHPVFCNKVGVRVGYLTVLDLTVQIISQVQIWKHTA